MVSSESVGLFLAKVQDKFTSTLGGISSDQSKYVQETQSNRRAAIVKSKQVKLQYFRHEVVSKQDSYSGYYTEYLKTLNASARTVDSKTRILLETLKMTVGTFINEFNDEKIDQIYGHVIYLDATKSLPSYKSNIAQFFNAPSGKVKTHVEDVIKSMQDIETLYGQIDTLGQLFSPEKVKEVQQQVQSVTDLIDSLVQININSGVLNRSVNCKKHLIEAIHITAQYVEYYHALLANWVFYCKAFNELTVALVKFPTES